MNTPGLPIAKRLEFEEYLDEVVEEGSDVYIQFQNDLDETISSGKTFGEEVIENDLKVKAYDALENAPKETRLDVDNVKKVENQVDINDTQYDRIKSGIDQVDDAQKHIDEIVPQKTIHDGPGDELYRPLADDPEVVDELKVANGDDTPITNDDRKFWWNHEINVMTYLVDFYDTRVGSQITVDITLVDGTPFTVRLDNVVAEGSTYRIIDAKSSIRVNLSVKKAQQLRTSTSTQNQKLLFDAIEKGKIQTAKPRGPRAAEFLDNDLSPIIFSRDIDFFVNDLPANGGPPGAGYNMFRKTLSL